jgi:hypothetical protein
MKELGRWRKEVILRRGRSGDREPVRSNRERPLYNCTKNELGNEAGTVGEFSTK